MTPPPGILVESPPKLGYRRPWPLSCLQSLWLLSWTCSDETAVGAYVGRNWQQPPANDRERPEARRPTVLEELSPANNHLSELGRRPDSSWAFRWDRSPRWHLDWSLLVRHWHTGPNKTVPGFLKHRNYEAVNICCSKPLGLGIIWYTAIDNEYSKLL